MLLDKRQEKLLQNRFFVTRARAEENAIPFLWQEYKEWRRDFEKIRPQDLSPEEYRISYDLGKTDPPEYSARTMEVRRNSSMVMRRKQERAIDTPANAPTTVSSPRGTVVDLTRAPYGHDTPAGISREQMALLAAEIALRLFSCSATTTSELEQLVEAAMDAVGVKL